MTIVSFEAVDHVKMRAGLLSWGFLSYTTLAKAHIRDSPPNQADYIDNIGVMFVTPSNALLNSMGSQDATGTTTAATYVPSQDLVGRQLPATTTVTSSNCPDYITVTIYASTSTMAPTSATYMTSVPSSVCTGTQASCPCITGYACMAMNQCTWACVSTPTTSYTFISSYVTPTPAASSNQPQASSYTDDSSAEPPYVSEDAASHTCPASRAPFSVLTSRTS